jgi:hypothetical protein
VGLTPVKVDSGTLTMGVNPLLVEGFTCKENDPCECLVDWLNTAPVVVVDQLAGFSNPNTSVAAVSADRATVTAESSLRESPQPAAALETRAAHTKRDTIDRRMPDLLRIEVRRTYGFEEAIRSSGRLGLIFLNRQSRV